MKQLSIFDALQVAAMGLHRDNVLSPKSRRPNDLLLYVDRDRKLSAEGVFGLTLLKALEQAAVPMKRIFGDKTDVWTLIRDDYNSGSMQAFDNTVVKWDFTRSSKAVFERLQATLKDRDFPLCQEISNHDVSKVLGGDSMLLPMSVEDFYSQLNEHVNKARWSGEWGDVTQAPRFKEVYDTVPYEYRRRYHEVMAALLKYAAYDFQRHDGTVSAIMGRDMITHNMGLGKSRICLLISEIINKPTIIVALPRLIRSVWTAEMMKLGLKDFAILERPRKSSLKLISRVKGATAKDLAGFNGIGKVTLAPIKREEGVTTDPFAAGRNKVVSYNMLLPGQDVKYDFVKCPVCQHVHNQETCNKAKVVIRLKDDNDKNKDKELSPLVRAQIAEIEARVNANELDDDGAIKRIQRLVGAKEYHVYLTRCGTPSKGALCPHCDYHTKKDIKIFRLGSKKNAGYHCRRCGYSARTYVPSMSRRIKKWAKNAFLDESQAIKNPDALRTIYTLQIRPKNRYLVSGTPATVDVARDLYDQLKWLIGPGIHFPFVAKKPFVEQFQFDNSKKSELEKQRSMKVFHRIMDPFQIRRSADDYGVNAEVSLPPVKERRLTVNLSNQEKENYDLLMDNFRRWMQTTVTDKTSDLDILSKTWMLRRAGIVPWIDRPSLRKSSKLEVLKTEVKNMLEHGHKVLIGTIMIDALDAIEACIPNVLRIDGDVPIEESNRRISLFQEACPQCVTPLVMDKNDKMVCPMCETKYPVYKVIAVSRSAVREGITLNKASKVILTDPDYVYSDMWQFWKRAHRIGATYDELEVIYMESEGTIDVKMYDLAEVRRENILKAVNRKDCQKMAKLSIRDFLRELASEKDMTLGLKAAI